MERVTAYLWRGTLYASQREAARAIDEAIGVLICKHGAALARIDKYKAACDYIEANAADMAEIAALQNDLTLESE